MLAVNRQVNVTSSHGAAATMIDALTVDVIQNGGEFGRPGKGFTVTNTATPSGDGIVNTAAGFFVTTPFTGAFEDNNVFSNGTNNPPPGVPNCGLTHDIADFVVGRNYWGSPAGPGADPADDICTFGGGTTLPVSSFAAKRYQVKATIEP